MCGFVGVVAPGAGRRFRSAVERATRRLAHRGPDDAGLYADADCVLGFRRLAIIDLEKGRQPMTGPQGTVLVYNGELYNFREVAARYPHWRLKTRSDTEVVAAALEERSTGALKGFDGMFALAHWDPARRRLTLARDRLGIKPLYHARLGDAFFFASEIRGLLELGVRPEANLEAIDAHLTLLWNPGPETAFRGVHRLPPGCFLTLEEGRGDVRSYWRMRPSPPRAEAQPADVRRAVLRDVSRQLVSDVPVGVFLSGGVDSSLIACAIPEGQVRRCYTITFPKKDLARDIIPDESRFARIVAEQKGLELVEVPVEFSADRFLETVRALEEPVGDPAAIATRALCAGADEKVLLSGMGGDELWGGYPRIRALELSRHLPGAVRPFTRLLQRVLPHSGHLGRFARNLAKLSSGAGLSWGARHVRFLSYAGPEERLGLYAPSVHARLAESPHERLLRLLPEGDDDLDISLRFDIEQFLTCHNLLYTDKASMWESKEVRVPLLGNTILQAAERFPASFKRGKQVLKGAAHGLVPDPVLRRKKAGFGAPVQGWLAGPLRPLLDEFLSTESVRKRGWFAPAAVQRLLSDERAGRGHRYLLIYELLTLEAWAREFVDGC